MPTLVECRQHIPRQNRVVRAAASLGCMPITALSTLLSDGDRASLRVGVSIVALQGESMNMLTEHSAKRQLMHTRGIDGNIQAKGGADISVDDLVLCFDL